MNGKNSRVINRKKESSSTRHAASNLADTIYSAAETASPSGYLEALLSTSARSFARAIFPL